jgi:hypothetical protein
VVVPGVPAPDTQELLLWLKANANITLAPYLADLKLHLTFIVDQHNWSMAALMMQQLQQLRAAAGGGGGGSDNKQQGALFESLLAHEFLPELPHRILEGMLELGLDPAKTHPETKQTLLHTALAGR